MAYKFVRAEQLPALCTEDISVDRKHDPMFNFEIFAETVKSHYAFMELNTIDWPKLYEQQKGKLQKNPTDVGLYKILEETLELLNDNHAYLEATDALYEALEALESDVEEESPEETLNEYGDFVIADMVAKHYLKEDMTEDSWLIKWGKMENNIGYIQVKAMWLYADLEIHKTLIEEKGYVDAYVDTFHQMNEGDYIKKEVAGVRKVMNRVMNDLIDSDKIIIDVRFNGGGQDAVSFEILRHFNSEKRQIVSTKLVHGTGYSPSFKIYLEPSAKAYTKPVFVLTSPQSGSAAESFAMSTMSIPNVKRIGTHTQGAISTALEKTLPNGWVFSISNEITMDNNGKFYENIGIPADYELNYPEDRQDFFRSVADNLEKDKTDVLIAIEKLGRQ